MKSLKTRLLLPEGNKSGGAGKAQTGEPMRKRRRHKATTELDVVLDAFLDFSNEYRYTENTLIRHFIHFLVCDYQCDEIRLD